jgi:hypothetical protein
MEVATDKKKRAAEARPSKRFARYRENALEPPSPRTLANPGRVEGWRGGLSCSREN